MLICRIDGCHRYAEDEGLCPSHLTAAVNSRVARIAMLENRVKLGVEEILRLRAQLEEVEVERERWAKWAVAAAKCERYERALRRVIENEGSCDCKYEDKTCLDRYTAPECWCAVCVATAALRTGEGTT